jgi:hypothetical protein
MAMENGYREITRLLGEITSNLVGLEKPNLGLIFQDYGGPDGIRTLWVGDEG